MQRAKRPKTRKRLKNKQKASKNTEKLQEEDGKLSPEQLKTLNHLIINKYGGFDKVYSYNSYKTILQKEGLNPTHLAQDQLFNYSREAYITKINQEHNLSLKPEQIRKAYRVFDKNELKNCEELVHKNEYCCLLKDFVGQFGINNELFSLDYIDKYRGNFPIDANQQSPIPNGFLSKKNRSLEQETFSWTVSQYIEYQEDHLHLNVLEEEKRLKEEREAKKRKRKEFKLSKLSSFKKSAKGKLRKKGKLISEGKKSAEGGDANNKNDSQELNEENDSGKNSLEKVDNEAKNPKFPQLSHKVYFGVNIDIGDWPILCRELETKLPPWLRYLSTSDLQGFFRNDILGMTIPQIYLKVPGCWTGGHQENLRLRAININHGPGSVEWYCVEPEEAEIMRKKIMKDHGIDVMLKEHHWYLDLEDTLKFGVKVSKLIQEPGDIVVLAPGTLHWVRSHQVTVNSAWNIGYLDYNQIDQLIYRFHLNLEIGFENLFPVRTFVLDLINYGMYKMDQKSRELLLKTLKFSIEEDKENEAMILDKIEEDNVLIKQVQKVNIPRCSLCKKELFNYWMVKSFDFNTKIFDCMCHHCLIVGKKKKINSTTKIFKKYQRKWLEMLYKKASKFSKEYKNQVFRETPLLESRIGDDVVKIGEYKFPLVPKCATPKFYLRNLQLDYEKRDEERRVHEVIVRKELKEFTKKPKNGNKKKKGLKKLSEVKGSPEKLEGGSGCSQGIVRLTRSQRKQNNLKRLEKKLMGVRKKKKLQEQPVEEEESPKANESPKKVAPARRRMATRSMTPAIQVDDSEEEEGENSNQIKEEEQEEEEKANETENEDGKIIEEDQPEQLEVINADDSVSQQECLLSSNDPHETEESTAITEEKEEMMVASPIISIPESSHFSTEEAKNEAPTATEKPSEGKIGEKMAAETKKEIVREPVFERKGRKRNMLDDAEIDDLELRREILLSCGYDQGDLELGIKKKQRLHMPLESYLYHLNPEYQN